MKNFNGRPFFSLFFLARANQKIRILALGRHSIDSLAAQKWDGSRGKCATAAAAAAERKSDSESFGSTW
jgi:hypothetical protein